MIKGFFAVVLMLTAPGVGRAEVNSGPPSSSFLTVSLPSPAQPTATTHNDTDSHLPPAPFAARYTAHWNKKGFGSQAVYRLTRLDPNRYLLQLSLSAPFLRAEEQVEFAWRKQRPQPLLYRKVRRTLGRERLEEARFNWDTQTVHWRKNDTWGTLPLPPDTLDKLSLQLTLACRLPQGDEDRLHFKVFDGTRIKPYIFKRLTEETLSLPIGTVRAVKVKRLREEDESQRKTFLWLAPGYHYLVVRMRQVEGSNDAEIKLKQIDQAPHHRPCGAGT